jgi:porin
MTRSQRFTAHGALPLGALCLGLALAGASQAQTADEFDTGHNLLGDPAGLRSSAAARGFVLDASLTGDYSAVLEGGESTRATAARYLIEAGMTIDTDTAFGLPGGSFYVGYVGFHGDDGSMDVGDFQGTSNIDAEPFDALYSLWYRQSLFDDRLSIKIGKEDANTDFAYVDNGGGFIHSSPGFSPTIQAFPSYPDPATSVSAFLRPGGGLYVGAGMYDGATQAGIRTGTRGPSTFYGEPSDLFWIGETGIEYGDVHNGRLGVGYWQHTGEFERFDAGTEDHADGAYIVWDQTIYADNVSAREVGLFAQYGWADEAISEVEHHASTGVQIQSLLTNRPDDLSGLMASYVAFSDAPGAGFSDDHELAIEAFHAIQAADWLTIKPDLQYIVNPGGMGLDDATVATLRAQISL